MSQAIITDAELLYLLKFTRDAILYRIDNTTMNVNSIAILNNVVGKIMDSIDHIEGQHDPYSFTKES